MAGTQAAELKEYELVVGHFRALAETRFKLIGLLPLGSVGTLLFIKGQEGQLVMPVAFFGAVITFALYVYHLRNDQLYGELALRAAQLEQELRLFEGSFVQRPSAWVRLTKSHTIQHGWPIVVVYAATVWLWLSFALGEAAKSLPLSAALRSGLSTSLTTCVVFALFAYVSVCTDRDGARLKKAVQKAMPLLEAVSLDAPSTGPELDEVAFTLRRALRQPRKSEDRLRRRLEFYLRPEHFQVYIGDVRLGRPLGRLAAARVLGSVIEQPARWIFDVSSGRRG